MTAHAEVSEVWPRNGHIRVTGHPHGLDAADGLDWQLLLTLRDKHHRYRLRYDAVVDDTTFDVSLPVDDLALDGLPRATWDLYLAPRSEDGRQPLRLGRHLDDIRDKKKIYVFPAQSVTSDEDATVVRPYYTSDDDLALACVPGDIPLRPGDIDTAWDGWIR